MDWWPFWALCTGWWSPWCWIDEVAHALFPMTFGFSCDRVSHWPHPEPWICRMHDRAIDRYWKRREEGDVE